MIKILNDKADIRACHKTEAKLTVCKEWVLAGKIQLELAWFDNMSRGQCGWLLACDCQYHPKEGHEYREHRQVVVVFQQADNLFT